MVVNLDTLTGLTNSLKENHPSRKIKPLPSSHSKVDKVKWFKQYKQNNQNDLLLNDK